MAKRVKVLTGVKPTGTPHVGNYFGALKPALAIQDNHELYLFIANLHALNTVPDSKQLSEYTYKVAAVYLSLGLDPKKTVFWRQSDVTEVLELMWYMTPFAPMGLLTRAHSYKDAKDKGKDINMGLFNYPLLMAADILLFSTDQVPVGQDQKQHCEIARDIAIRFNNQYGDILTIPEPVISEQTAIVPGIDGRKMSKSYNNEIPIFESSKNLRKCIMKIVTDSKELDEPKDPNDSIIIDLYKLIASKEEVADLSQKYRQGGYGYGHAKQDLFLALEGFFGKSRQEYFRLINDKAYIDKILLDGARRARDKCGNLMEKVRQVVGLK